MECEKLGKCTGKTRNNNLCNKKCLGKYCQFHEYLKDYTEEMIKNSKLCKGCSKWKYFQDKTCDFCKDRGKENREKVKENIIFCKYLDKENNQCSFKVEPKLNNGYCGKHQTYFFKEDKEKDGKNKVCLNFIRGCRNLLDKADEFSRCLICREKDRSKDKERNIVRKDKREEINKKIKIKLKNEKKLNDILICSGCKSPRNLYTFLENEKDIESELYKTCKICREKDLIRNKDEDRIQYKKEYEKSENRQNYIDTNIEKRVQITSWDNYKIIKIKDLGLHEFLSIQLIRYNELKPKYIDKIKEYYNKKKSDKEFIFNNYCKSAKDRDILFNLNKEDFYKLINDKCYYCGFFNENYFNGVDRLNSDLNYEKDNCVSCCSECNILKLDFEKDKFINMIKHILSNFGFLKEFNFNLFSDCISGDFNKYMNCAIKRNYEFNLEHEKFIIIQSMNCYLCNKPSDSKNHINGIDRVNNEAGYNYDNILACCKDCNKLKNNYSIKYIFTKFYNIANYLGYEINIDLDTYLEKVNRKITNKQQFLLNEIELNNQNSEKTEKSQNQKKIKFNNNKLNMENRKKRMIQIMGEGAYKNYVNTEKNYFRYKKSKSIELMKIYAEKLSEIKQKYPKIFSKSIIETKEQIVNKGIKKIDESNSKKEKQLDLFTFKLHDETFQKIQNLKGCINHFKKKNNKEKIEEYEEKLDNYKKENKDKVDQMNKIIEGNIPIEKELLDLNKNINDKLENKKDNNEHIEPNYCRITKNDIPLKSLIGKDNYKIYHKVESNLSYARKTNNNKKEEYYTALLNYLKTNINTSIANKTLITLNLRKLESDFIFN